MSDGIYASFPRRLPEGLESLTELALDLRWTWSHSGDRLWEMVDPDAWQVTENPWVILQHVPQERLEELAGDAAFRRELDAMAEQRSSYLATPGALGADLDSTLGTIAYFSMEFGLGAALPLYAGGLGILAGDYLKTASDLGLPVVGVGLLYQEGYFRQTVDREGRQQAVYTYNEPATLPIQPVLSAQGGRLRVVLEFPGRRVLLRVWEARVGRVMLYLLDSNDPFNAPVDRGITGKLYGGGREMRLMQEIVLGIGGWRLLEMLGMDVRVCHLNEGHAAFAILERIRQLMRKTGLGFEEALWATRAGNVFTTHTPVPAGFDTFDAAVVERHLPYFRRFLAELGVSLEEILKLGRRKPEDPAEPFNMACLAMKCSRGANGVSSLHRDVSRRGFGPLYPRWPEVEVPLGYVTNGVHVPSWDSPWADRLWTESCGAERWRESTEAMDQAIQSLDDETLWSFCMQERRDLVGYVRRRLARQRGQSGADAESIESAGRALDPNVLIVGFARRFAEYKRPNLLLHDPLRLGRLLTHPERPIQVIVAGKAHPDDREAVGLVQGWSRFASLPAFRDRVVFLEDYDIPLAQELVQGVDVWINTPRRPWEACGTSGMKILVNGGLNLSALDGWWAEAYSSEVGWSLGDGAEGQGPELDALDAEELYRVLETEVTPLFYDRDSKGIPRGWVKRMRHSMSRLAPRFSSNRMVEEYLRDYYLPAAAAWERRTIDGARVSRELLDWSRRTHEGWSRLHFGEARVDMRDSSWLFSIPVYLCDVAPEDVRVELYAVPEREGPPIRHLMELAEEIPGAVRGYIYRGLVSADRPSTDYTARIVPFHPDAAVPTENGLILWQN